MVSLAALKFGDVFAEQGGPVERVDAAEFPVLGTTHWLANAFLRAELSGGGSASALFGSADGTGVAESPAAAGHEAIAEALERWAYLALLDSPAGRQFGFLEDRSSIGMAAFPGLFRRQVQNLARAEAIEQHAVVSWWDGRLPAERVATPFPGVEAARLHHDAGPGEVVIVYRRARTGYAYGHAFGLTLAQAIRRAAVGLARAEHVLAVHRACGALAEPGNFLERRMLYFASEEGAERFGRQLLARPTKAALPFRLLFDGELPGPWSRWATVWRCCARMPTGEHLDPDTDFFFW